MFKINNPKRQMCLSICKQERLEKEIAGMKQIKGISPQDIAQKQAQLNQVKQTVASYKSRYA